ncbi:heavy metal efflux pump CzcA, partial [Pseudomonas syringae pv. pisi str. 1704B]
MKGSQHSASQHVVPADNSPPAASLKGLAPGLVPAAIAMFVTGKVKEEEGFVMRTARQRYAPILSWVLGHRSIAFGMAFVLIVLSGFTASR